MHRINKKYRKILSQDIHEASSCLHEGSRCVTTEPSRQNAPPCFGPLTRDEKAGLKDSAINTHSGPSKGTSQLVCTGCRLTPDTTRLNPIISELAHPTKPDHSRPYSATLDHTRPYETANDLIQPKPTIYMTAPYRTRPYPTVPDRPYPTAP